MTSPVWLFLYSPFPYWAIATFLAYRHDLSRFIHPMRDHGNLKAWWSVCRYLGLIDQIRVPEPSARRGVIPFVACLLASAVASLSWTLRAFPLVWYYLLLAQAMSGLILFAATFWYLGPLPSRPYADALAYPRLGSRIRHLAKVPRSGTYRPPRTAEQQDTEVATFPPGMQNMEEHEMSKMSFR